ncbi:MAG: cadherin domain-containing protein [Pseudomonadales bacterium]
MNQPPQLPVLVLSIRPPNGRIREIPIATDPRVPATPETAYALIDVADGEAPESLAAHREGDDLVVEVQDVEVLVLEGFFSSAGVAFYPTTNIAGGVGLYSGTPLTPQSPGLSQSTDSDKVVWTTDRSDGDGDGGSGMLWGAAAVGGLAAVLAAAGGGGGGSGGGGSNPGTGGGGSAPPVNNTVEGSVVGGPVIDGNGLSVQVFEANGTTLLGEAVVGADGSFSLSVGDYTGVIIARVVDADDGADYLDEASNADKDLNASLGAVAVISGSNTTINLNSLSTLGAALAERQAGTDTPTPTDVTDSNAAIAALFGLSDLDAVSVVPVNGGTYDAADGLSAGERYGALLAAFSGADLNNGGDSQQTIDAVLTGLTVAADGTAQLSESAQALLVQGALTTDLETGTNLAQFVSSIVDTLAPEITSGATAPAIMENSGAGQVVYTAVATDVGAVTYGLGGSDASDFTIDPDSGVVTLNVNPDFEAQPSFSFSVVATDLAGNSAEQTVTLGITDTDDSAPVVTSGAIADPIDENSGAGQVIYTVTSEDPISDAGSDPTTYSLGAGADAAAFTIDATTGEVTLSADPDFEAKPSYSFTVIATDGDGNSGQQPVTLAINNLDEVAPTITSSAVAAAIDENSGAGQEVYTATSTDTGDISTGNPSYSLAGADATAFSIDPASGAVTLTGDPNFEAKSSYSFSVVATDAAGNSSDPQAVTLAINNLDDTAPTITSSGVAAAIDENSGPGQVVYTAISTDDDDVSTGSTAYSLAGADAAAFSIDPASGAVTLTGNPNFEAKSSYNFSVVATDAAGNSSNPRAVRLNINNLDEVAPTITSSGVAPAIDENSGAGQEVYTATSTDTGDISTGNPSYSLAGADATAFNINAASGVVTLKANPDFETKPNYSFAVVATDAAGNSSAPRAVSLAINDIADETAPTVSSVALTSATGAQNNTLNAGDTVTVTVTMSESTNVDTSGATPRVALNVGGSTVFAGYVSGTGTNSLSFSYTVQPGDTDLNGISIPTNALQSNGGTLGDATGNVANLSHGPVAGNPSYLVDTTAPTLTSSTPADDAVDVAVGDDLVLVFSEAVQAASGDLEIRTGGDNRTIDVTDGTQIAISGNQVTVDPTDDLEGDSSYRVQIDEGAFTDAAGNPYAGIDDNTTLNFDTASTADPSIVVFDLLEGVNSDHSGRTFDPSTSYTIYIRVDSTDSDLSTDGNGPGQGDSWGTWSGGSNLGSDDRIVLVGSGADVEGEFGTAQSLANVPSGIFWNTFFAAAAFVGQNGQFSRFTGSTDSAVLWSGNWAANPDAGSAFNQVYLTQMPANVLTSQGLA